MSTGQHTTGSNTKAAKEHEIYHKAIVELRAMIKRGDAIIGTKFTPKYNVHPLIFQALRLCNAIKDVEGQDIASRRNGTKYTWIYHRHNEKNNDMVDAPLVDKVMEHVKEIRLEYQKRAKAKKKGKISSTVVRRESLNPSSIEHQISYLKDMIEREKIAKGYNRPEAAAIYPHILSNLEALKIVKDLV